MYRRRPSCMTSDVRYCASIRIGVTTSEPNGRVIQVNFESPRALVQALKDYVGPKDLILKIYQKGSQQ
jgi:hypothetical protein